MTFKLYFLICKRKKNNYIGKRLKRYGNYKCINQNINIEIFFLLQYKIYLENVN